MLFGCTDRILSLRDHGLGSFGAETILVEHGTCWGGGVFILSSFVIDHGLVASVGVRDARAHVEIFTKSHGTSIYLSLSVVNADFSCSEIRTGALLTAFEFFLMADVNEDCSLQ